jgi:hypothetical protein
VAGTQRKNTFHAAAGPRVAQRSDKNKNLGNGSVKSAHERANETTSQGGFCRLRLLMSIGQEMMAVCDERTALPTTLGDSERLNPSGRSLYGDALVLLRGRGVSRDSGEASSIAGVFQQGCSERLPTSSSIGDPLA